MNEDMRQWLIENTDRDVHETILTFRKENVDNISILYSRMIAGITCGDLESFNNVLLIYGALVATHVVRNRRLENNERS